MPQDMVINMSMKSLHRVCNLLRERFPDNRFKRNHVREAIEQEIGTHPRTFKTNYKSLKQVGAIKGIMSTNDLYVSENW